MPKAKRNGKFLDVLQDMRDEHESDSNKYMILNKALNSLKKEAKEYLTADSLIDVKFIGPKIVSDLKKRLKDAGGTDTMGEIPSNIPSPNKRKRNSGATSASEPGKRGRPPKQPLFSPESDEDEALPIAKRHAPPPIPPRENPHNFQADVPFGFHAPQYPLGVPPPTHNATIANPQRAYHHAAPNHLYGSQNSLSQIYKQALDHLPTNVVPQMPPQIAHSAKSFHFSYLDESGRQVPTCDKAMVDIEAGAMWYKFGFIDNPESKAHPLKQRIRMDPYDNRKEKRRDEFIQAWIRDEDVEAFGLQRAPGILLFPNNIDVDRHALAGTSEVGSQITNRAQDRDVGRAAVKPKTNEMSNGSGGSSLGDLLKAENKKKRNTIDPSRRVTDAGKHWNIRNGGVMPTSDDGMIKKEAAQSQQPNIPQDSMRQRMASAALARQQSSSIMPEPSFSSSQSKQYSTSVMNTSLRRTNTLPEVSGDPNITQRAPYALSKDFNVLFDSPDSSAPASVRHPAQQAPEGLRRTVTAPGKLPPPASAAPPLPKSKPKGRARGRVSEFAPNLRAVDEFDDDLDRQASQRMHPQIASTSASSASADLIDDVTDLTMADAPSFPQFSPIIFPRDSFEVIMVLDNREIKSQDNRSHILNELQKKGVNVVQRSLALGDVLWIAKRRNLVAAEDENECVLDYILERKRLDDLCLSIKDGRFREQKFRLTNTGLKVFYLIEEYDLDKNREIFGVQIDTARSSTQIVDDFIVKETKKLSYTIDFLVTMHRTIESKYRDESLYMIPSNIIRRHSYMALQKHLRNNQPTIRYLTSYPSFENLNNKSKNLTMKDLFTQMLLCVNGVSPEKASAIVATYPTLRDLWEAFRIAELDEKEGNRLAEEGAMAAERGKKGKGKAKKQKVPQAKEMLCGLEASGRQRIGPALSANIYRLLRANSYKE